VGAQHRPHDDLVLLISRSLARPLHYLGELALHLRPDHAMPLALFGRHWTNNSISNFAWHVKRLPPGIGSACSILSLHFVCRHWQNRALVDFFVDDDNPAAV